MNELRIHAPELPVDVDRELRDLLHESGFVDVRDEYELSYHLRAADTFALFEDDGDYMEF